MKYLLVPLLILSTFIFYTPVYAADTVTFDNSAVNGPSAFTVGNHPNRILIFEIVCNGGANTSAVNWDTTGTNQSATLLLGPTSFGTEVGNVTVWYLLAPTVVSGGTWTQTGCGGGANGQVYSYYNVNQAAPEASAITTGASGTTLSGSVTTITPNAVVWAGSGFQGNAAANTASYSTNMGNNRNPADGTAQTGATAGNMNADSGAIASPGSVTSTHTVTAATQGTWSISQVVLKPSGASQTMINFGQQI